MPLLAGGGVLRHRDYRILFAGQAVSVVGDALFPIALAFAVIEGLDGTPTQQHSASCSPRRSCR